MEYNQAVRKTARGDTAAAHQLFAAFGGSVAAICDRYAASPADAQRRIWENVIGRIIRSKNPESLSIQTLLADAAVQQLGTKQKELPAVFHLLFDLPVPQLAAVFRMKTQTAAAELKKSEQLLAADPDYAQSWKNAVSAAAMPAELEQQLLTLLPKQHFAFLRKPVFWICAVLVIALAAGGFYLWRQHAQAANIHHAEIVIQDYGTISVELDANAAPISVQHFMDLAKSGYYDGSKFHRIIQGFMMQGGAPNGDPNDHSGETIKGEFSANGWDDPIEHKRGVISMARATAYDSASSQFFIMQEDNAGLDGQYAAFGHVTDGMDIVDEICDNTPVTDNNGSVDDADRPVIETIRIID